MQRDVHQVVTPRLEATQQMIQAKGQHAERPVAAVRAAILKGSAPEVILQQPMPRSAGQQVRVRQDGPSATAKYISVSLNVYL